MRDALRAALSAYEPQPIEAEPGMPLAAVLVLCYEHQGRAHVIFQKRTQRVETHKGQVSFPGGMADPGDISLRHTALRETHEEIGVVPADVELLGQLDDILTLARFRVTPFVGWKSASITSVSPRRLFPIGGSSMARRSSFLRTSTATI